MSDATKSVNVNAAVSAARDLPDLVTRLGVLDPALAQQFEGKALVASRSPWGTLLGTALGYAAVRYGINWPPDFIALASGAGVMLGTLAGAYVMRKISSAPITGLWKKATTGATT